MHRLFAGGAVLLTIHLTVVSLVLTATQAVGQQLATDGRDAWPNSDRLAEVEAKIDGVVDPGATKRRSLTERSSSAFPVAAGSASDSATDRAVSALRGAMRSNARAPDSSDRSNGFRGGGIPGRSGAREQRSPQASPDDPRVNTGSTDELREVATKVLMKLTHALQLNRLTQAMNAAAYLHDVLEDMIGSYGRRDEKSNDSSSDANSPHSADEKDDPQAVAKFKLLSHINELEDILQQNVRSNNFANALSVRAELGLARQELEDLESAASESTSKTTGTGTIQSKKSQLTLQQQFEQALLNRDFILAASLQSKINAEKH